MAAFDNPAFADHEKVVFFHDKATGLKAIIAVHSTVLGPAAGGCRLWGYRSDDEALSDVLRLSKAMSYKNAMADLKFGGGKAVIIKTADFRESDALYEKFGQCVDELGGAYVTAEDVGMSVSIMETIARKTKHVSGLPKREGHAGGDPSPMTSYGIFKGIEAATKFQLDRDSVEGMTVAIQGVGNVGYYLSKYLTEAGAKLKVADINAERVKRVCKEFGASEVSLREILFQEVDVVAPCALGAILTSETIPRLQTRIIAGGANNQLATDADGKRLMDEGILYAPDYVINGGGIINVACEYYGGVEDAEVLRQVAEIGPRLMHIFEKSRDSGEPTNVIADNLARQIIADRAAA